MKIVLAIPTYNDAEYLSEILPEALKQGFYKVYVLDDASTDNSRAVLSKYPSVAAIHGKINAGPVANRNRILGHDPGDVIFFLDVDMRLDSSQIPKKLEKIYKHNKGVAIVGGSVFRPSGEQLIFSYDKESNPLFRWAERPFTGPRLTAKDIDVPLKDVAWVLEGAFAIESKVFTRLNGFDESFKRYQEGPDICKRALNAGYRVTITNKIKVTHTRDLSVFRVKQMFRYFASSLTWYRKHVFKQKRPT